MPIRVLVVDDHEGFQRMARRLLVAGGYDVVGLASAGLDAVKQAATLRPDVVLLDVLLPDLDGFQVAEHLAGLSTPPAVVLISSRSRAEFGIQLEGAPVRGFVTKDELTLQRLAELVQ